MDTWKKKPKKSKFKSGDKVKFTSGSGKVWTGTVVNPSYYPGGNRAGKHYRIDVGGMIATIFATGEVGKSVEKEK